MQKHADKIGIVGASVAALCCLGIPAVLSIVAALGLSFLINDAILAPLLAASLLLVLWGLMAGWKRHHRLAALGLGAAAAVGLFVFSFIHQSTALAVASIAGLILASVLNVALARWPATATLR